MRPPTKVADVGRWRHRANSNDMRCGVKLFVDTSPWTPRAVQFRSRGKVFDVQTKARLFISRWTQSATTHLLGPVVQPSFVHSNSPLLREAAHQAFGVCVPTTE